MKLLTYRVLIVLHPYGINSWERMRNSSYILAYPSEWLPKAVTNYSMKYCLYEDVTVQRDISNILLSSTTGRLFSTKNWTYKKRTNFLGQFDLTQSDACIYRIYPAIRRGFPFSRMTTNNKISPKKFCYNTSFTLPKQSKRSRSVL